MEKLLPTKVNHILAIILICGFVLCSGCIIRCTVKNADRIDHSLDRYEAIEDNVIYDKITKDTIDFTYQDNVCYNHPPIGVDTLKWNQFLECFENEGDWGSDSCYRAIIDSNYEGY